MSVSNKYFQRLPGSAAHINFLVPYRQSPSWADLGLGGAIVK